jgi:hypothetical protein
MFIVDDENGIALHGSGQPLGIRCHCGHRALIPQDRLPPKIGAGSVVKLRDQNWKCSICGGRRVELVMFWNTVQSLAFSDGEPYRTVWSLRLHGKDTTEEPWCRYVDEPNPFREHDPEVPELDGRSRPVSRWKSGVRVSRSGQAEPGYADQGVDRGNATEGAVRLSVSDREGRAQG